MSILENYIPLLKKEIVEECKEGGDGVGVGYGATEMESQGGNMVIHRGAR